MSQRRALSTIAALVVLGLVVLASGCDLTTGDIVSGPPTAVVDNSGGEAWYRLYFTEPDITGKEDNPTGGLPELIAASMDTAQKTLDVAVYEFNWMPLAEALIRAEERGVAVRLVTDTDTMGEEAIAALTEAGIPVVDDQRSAIMHDKFVIVDGATVWMGSMNFTINDAYKNNNSMMEITSSRLAQNYTAKFEQLFEQHVFGRAFTPPNPTVTINGTEMENYFSPDSGVAAAILEELEAAQSSLYFMAFTFTRTDMAEAMIERANAGVAVQGVFESRQISAGADAAWNALTAAGLDVRKDGNSRTMHHKVIIIDGQTVVMGSYNFSKNAEENNDENILIIHNADIAAAYMAEWQKVWALGK